MRKRRTVLVVDDDAHARETLKDIFEEEGYSVTLAENGEEALDRIKERPQDIVFLDMKMPVLDGFSTFLFAQAIDSEIVVVLMTAYQQAMKEFIDRALTKGAYACLYKPFDPQEALNIIEKLEAGK